MSTEFRVSYEDPTLKRLRATVNELLTELSDRYAKIAAALALADQWAAVDGHDQRAATLHTVADRLRAVLGKPGQP